jgi:ABC-type glycerol-3-phosphate transport system permease component
MANIKNKRNTLRFEKRSEKLLETRAYLRRQAIFVLIALGFLIISLAIGMMGYHFFECQSWLDSFLNAAMIMGGMGPASAFTTNAGKLFAGLYALYSGLGLLVTIGFIAAPLLHRFFHYFHLDIANSDQ